MNYDSIYPDFFKTGVGRLQKQGAWSLDFQGLFAALEHFRRDLADQREVKTLLQVTELYVLGLGLFKTVGFFVINPRDLGFGLAHCAPEGQSGVMEKLVGQEIRTGRFAWALRQNRPVFFMAQAQTGSVRGVFHTMGVATHRLGMFCGLLERERVPSQEVTFNLLSILLGASSDALAGIRTTEELRNKVLAANNSLQQALTEKESLIHELQEALAKVKTLSGLVPICAWCKKIRDDQGFWRQVEVFVQSHSDAVFTHGVCPECRSKFARQPAGLGAPA